MTDHQALNLSPNGSITPPTGPAAEAKPERKGHRRQSHDEKVKAEILAQMQEQAAIEKFQRERPELWLHVQRVARLMAMQTRLPEQTFPPGACFLHTNLPDQHCFCLKRVLEVNLETCTATVEIHEDNELTEGIAVLPVEHITWLGFPAHAVPLTFEMRGLVPPEDGPANSETVRIKTMQRGQAAAGEAPSAGGEDAAGAAS